MITITLWAKHWIITLWANHRIITLWANLLFITLLIIHQSIHVAYYITHMKLHDGHKKDSWYMWSLITYYYNNILRQKFTQLKRTDKGNSLMPGISHLIYIRLILHDCKPCSRALHCWLIFNNNDKNKYNNTSKITRTTHELVKIIADSQI